MSGKTILCAMLVFVPISLWPGLRHAPPTAVFVVSCLAILPLAGIMGEATEHLAHRAGPGVGGLLNATFGNAAELILSYVASLVFQFRTHQRFFAPDGGVAEEIPAVRPWSIGRSALAVTFYFV